MADESPERSAEGPEETSPSGSPLLRHGPRKMPFQVSIGDGEVIDAVGDHIESTVGPIAWVFHEIVSDLIHLDLYVVEPTAQRPFFTIVTSGMSEAPMTTPSGMEGYRFAELAICLPPSWPLSRDAANTADSPLKYERHYWPLRLLKTTARMTHAYDTWLCHGHTVSNGDPPEPYAPGVGMQSTVLLPSLVLPKAFWKLERGERTTHFWSLYPLHPQEQQLKLDKGLDPLIDAFETAGVTDLLNPHRPSSVTLPAPLPSPLPPPLPPSLPNRVKPARKKWFGWF